MAQATAAARYPRRERRKDVRRGHRDGRKQIPTYSSVLERNDQGGPVGTAYEDVLKSRSRRLVGERLTEFWQTVDGHRRALATLKGLYAMDEVSLANAEKAMTEARLELTESDLLPRNPIEVGLAKTDPDELRARRAAERQRAIVEIRSELKALREQAAAHAKEVAERDELIQVEFVQAQADARTLHDSCLIRMSAYWDALIQRHPEGRNLATIRPPAGFELPAWIAALRWDDLDWDDLEPPEETGP